MSDPVILRIIRPYESVEEYLAAEAGTIDVRGMLLVDAEPLPEGTLVRFSISLRNGDPFIKAEGLVRRYREPQAHRKGGLLVQFKRFGASTKSFIDQAIAQGGASDDGEEDGLSSAGDPSTPEAAAALLDSAPDAAAGGPTAPSATGADVPRIAARLRGRGGAVLIPPGRNAVLERLRTRARGLAPAALARLSRGTARS